MLASCPSPRLRPLGGARLARFGLEEPAPLVVPAGTLVLADTSGFHRRGFGAPGTPRPYTAVGWRGRGRGVNPDVEPTGRASPFQLA